MTVETALQALIIKSANDVAVMLAEAVAGSHEAFVARMNATAARLGMTRTKFANANGLPAPEQVTTARDLAKLSAAVVRDYPEYAHMWSMLDAKVGKRHLRSHNGLLTNYAGADGIKTGFICDSGFNVVASATRDGRKMIAVVLGEATGGERSVRAANLLEHGFQTHEWKALFASADARDHADGGGRQGPHDHPPAGEVVRVRHGRPAPRRGQDAGRRGRRRLGAAEGRRPRRGPARHPFPPGRSNSPAPARPRRSAAACGPGPGMRPEPSACPLAQMGHPRWGPALSGRRGVGARSDRSLRLGFAASGRMASGLICARACRPGVTRTQRQRAPATSVEVIVAFIAAFSDVDSPRDS